MRMAVSLSHRIGQWPRLSGKWPNGGPHLNLLLSVSEDLLHTSKHLLYTFKFSLPRSVNSSIEIFLPLFSSFFSCILLSSESHKPPEHYRGRRPSEGIQLVQFTHDSALRGPHAPLNTISSLHTNELCLRVCLQIQVVHKSNKVSLGAQITHWLYTAVFTLASRHPGLEIGFLTAVLDTKLWSMQKHNRLQRMHSCDSVHQAHELTYTIGHVNTCSHLWKFATWRRMCKGTCDTLLSPSWNSW